MACFQNFARGSSSTLHVVAQRRAQQVGDGATVGELNLELRAAQVFGDAGSQDLTFGSLAMAGFGANHPTHRGVRASSECRARG